MPTGRLVRLFADLPPPGPGDPRSVMSAHAIPGLARHRLARQADGAPAVLLGVSSSGSSRTPAPVALEHVAIQHDVPCRLSRMDGQVEEGLFSVIRCLAADDDLRFYFLTVMDDFVESLGPDPSRSAITDGVSELARLFAAMATPRRGTTRGLWAELFLIARSPDPAAMVECWHGEDTDRYDFSLAEQRLDVKSSANRTRQHHFSLDQLMPAEGTTLLIASVFVEASSGGDTIGELSARIRSRLADRPELLLSLDSRIAASIGDCWRETEQQAFDKELAEQSLQFYASTAVPSLPYEVPPGVSDIRFQSDLSRADPVDPDALRREGGLFAIAV